MKNIFIKHKKNLRNIIFYSYRKFKSYVYYASSLTHFKVIIANFESSESGMEESFQLIESILLSPHKNTKEINGLLDKISYRVLPKFTHSRQNEDAQIISNAPIIQNIDKVNFFIEAPIELLILDTLWTMVYGRLFFDYKLISPCVKSNKIAFNLFDFNKADVLDSINFKSLQLFVPYFKQYQRWKNGAINCIDGLYNQKTDSVLFSLDLTNYYYSVDINFDDIKKSISSDNDERVFEFKNINSIIEAMYKRFSLLVSTIRSDVDKNTLLPIGLTSSCLLANYYLREFDKRIIELKPKYYARYVDDMLVVFEDRKREATKREATIEEYIDEYLNSLLTQDEQSYRISTYPLLRIQLKKIKIIRLDHNESKSGLDSLIKDAINASEPNLIPNLNASIEGFLKSVYNNNIENGAKIRDLEAWNMDKLNLMRFISNYIKLRMNTNLDRKSETNLHKKRKRIFKTQYEELSYETLTQLKMFFSSNIIFDIYDKWEQVFYFTLLLHEDINTAYQLYENIKNKIDLLEVKSIDYIIEKHTKQTTETMKKDMLNALDISFSLGIAVRYQTTKYPIINKLAKAIRRANIFNHRMVSCPLINFIATKDQPSYHFAEYEKYQKIFSGINLSERYIKLSPRYIHLHEYIAYKNSFFTDKLFDADFYNIAVNEYYIISNELGNKNKDEVKFKVKNFTKPTKSSAIYNVNHYYIESKKPTDYNNLHIALANINIEKHGILDKNLNKIVFNNLSAENKYDLYRLLESSLSYSSVANYNIRRGNRFANIQYPQKKKLIKYLVFPELSIPLEWMCELCEFVKDSRIAIICGIKYFKLNSRIYNTVATILPISSELGFKSAIPILREKNDYSPLEKRAIENNGLVYNNREASRYDIFHFDGIDFSVFNCYELTDIYARANMKSCLDLLFIPEYNEDINYFSNIIESSSRDIYCFVAQVNSSNFGDTRIIAPFDDKRKNVLAIKGGEKSSLHVGRVNIKEFRDYQKHEHTKEYKKALDDQIAAKKDIKKESNKYRKYKKTSARHKPRSH